MINDWIAGLLRSFGAVDWIVVLVTSIVSVVALLGFVVLSVLFATWIERKLIGRFQIRYGPNRAGKFGLLQPVADAIKVMGKEAITPFDVDKLVFWAAPIVAFLPGMLTWAVVPFAPGAALADLDTGILFVMAIGALGVVPVFMAGWASNNKYSLLGAMRAVAQTVSYEIPLVLSLVGLILFANSLRLSDLVAFQHSSGWFLFLQPLAFVCFFIAASAELNRTPTDIMEGESEIVGGYHTEYSGFKFSLFYVAEYTHLFAVSALVTTLFLGGWGIVSGLEFVPGVVWFILFVVKVNLVFCVFVWTRATLPRLRVDQLMDFAWKFLIPLTLINIGVAAVEVFLALPGVLVFLVNVVLAGILIAGWTQVLGKISGLPPHLGPAQPRAAVPHAAR